VVANSSCKRPLSRAGRVVRVTARASIGLLLAGVVYVGLVQLDLVRSPLDPEARGDLALARGKGDGLRVLFIGNSFTFENDLPALVHDLAAGDPEGEPVFGVEYVAPAWSLRRASEDEGLSHLLDEVRWDIVVLQERSQLPSLPSDRRRVEIEPFARVLDAKISAIGAKTVLFMTWGYERGDDENVQGDTYTAMQERLRDGYTELGADLSASVAPVGLAWAEAVGRSPQLDLWARDGRHPTRAGSYLAACVLYGVLAARDPSGSRFTAGLEPALARELQQVASDVLARQEPL
jgi:uncharacterized protein DUF4886